MNLFSKKLLLQKENEWGFTEVTGTWNKVITDGVNYIAVGSNGNYTTSSKGVSWTTPAQLVENQTNYLQSVAYIGYSTAAKLRYIVAGNDILCASTTFPDMIFTSVTTGANWQDATFSDSKMVVVGQSSGYLATADTSIPSQLSWTVSSNKFGYLKSPQCVKYISDLDLFVTAGDSGYVSTSTNGTTWTSPTQIASYINWQDITYANNKIILVGSRLAGSHMSYISTSTNGTSWTSPVYIGDGRRSIAYRNGEYIAVGDNGGLSISKNLTSWERTTTDITTNWKSIIAGNDRFVMVGVGYMAYKEF